MNSLKSQLVISSLSTEHDGESHEETHGFDRPPLQRNGWGTIDKKILSQP